MTKLFNWNNEEKLMEIFIKGHTHNCVERLELLEFCILIDNLFRLNSLPYRIKKKEPKEPKKIKQGLGGFL